MSFRPAVPAPPEEEREAEASDMDTPSSLPWALLFSLWKPRGERIMGDRTLDRLPPFFFFVDDGGGEARSMLDLLLAAAALLLPPAPPGRLGILNGEGAGPRVGTLLALLPVAAVLAERNFMVPASIF